MESTAIKCEFCGKELEPMVLNWGRKLIQIGNKPCTCPSAIEQQQRETEYQKAKEIERKHRERLERYGRAGIPPKFIGAKYEDEPRLKRLMNRQSVYAYGPVGTGKTYYAMALAKQVLDAGKSAAVTSASKIKGELFSTSFGGMNTEEQLFQRLRRPFLLVIDDLGKEHDSKAVVSMLYRVINERDEQQLPVLITSNYTEKGLYERLAESGDESAADSIVSRIHGITKDGGMVPFDGEDWRM